MLIKNETILLSLLVSINIIIGLIGYIIGKLNSSGGVSYSKPQSFFNRKDDSVMDSNLSIDEKKVVLEIKTDNLERKYETLGDIKKTDDNITESVSKLKNLKR